MEIVEILKVGLSGLVFLLALLGYRLLRDMAQAPKQDIRLARAIRLYMLQTTFLAILVAVISLVPILLKHRDLTLKSAECNSSLGRLKVQASLEDINPSEYRVALGQHAATCDALFRQIDANQRQEK